MVQVAFLDFLFAKLTNVEVLTLTAKHGSDIFAVEIVFVVYFLPHILRLSHSRHTIISFATSVISVA